MPTLRSRRFSKMLPAGTISAGSAYFEDFTKNPEMLREVPFNNIIIRNFSACRLVVKYGHDSVAVIGANEIFSDNEAYGLTTLSIENTSEAATDDLIYYQVSRVVTGDMAMVAMATGENLLKIANGEA